jgi:hypothetical protein
MMTRMMMIMMMMMMMTTMTMTMTTTLCVQANGVLQKDPLLVAGRYLRGWFLIDVFSSFPFSLIPTTPFWRVKVRSLALIKVRPSFTSELKDFAHSILLTCDLYSPPSFTSELKNFCPEHVPDMRCLQSIKRPTAEANLCAARP